MVNVVFFSFEVVRRLEDLFRLGIKSYVFFFVENLEGKMLMDILKGLNYVEFIELVSFFSFLGF